MCASLWRGLFAAVLFVAPLHARAAGGPIENLLGDLERRTNAVVNNAAGQARGVVMESGQAALNLIGAFRAAYADSLKKTSQELTAAQRQALENILASVNALEGVTMGVTHDLQKINETLSNTVKNLPFGKGIPGVFQVAPVHFVAEPQKPVEVTISGANLAAGTPVLKIGGETLLPRVELDNKLAFAITPKASGAVVEAELTVFESRTRFFVWPTLTPHTYRVALVPVPQVLGSFQLSAKRNVVTKAVEARTAGPYRCESPRGEGGNTVAAQIVPRNGWEIDTTTIQYQRAYSNHGSWTLNGVSPAGFTAVFTCSGWGRVTAFGAVVDAGSIGVETGSFTYTEVQSVASPLVETVKQGELTWGQSVAVPNLPEDTQTIALTLNPYVGPSVALQGTSSDRFVSLDFNAAARTAIIRARRVDEALRQ